MKKFEQFIQEDNHIDTITVLRIYSEYIVDKWYKNIENDEEIKYIRIPSLQNLTEDAKRKKGRLVFRVILDLPHDLDEAIEALENIKKICFIKDCFHNIEIENSRATIRIEIAYDKIDETLLKSLSGINKYNL